jgi:hypothetical protein
VSNIQLEDSVQFRSLALKKLTQFMILDNKKFRNNRTGEVIQVISSFENIAILENKQKAKVTDLLNTSLYTEEIDPSSFFSNQGSYNILAEKIKNIPSHLIKDDGGETGIDIQVSDDRFKPNMNESAIVMTTEEDERAELARKYGVTIDNNSAVNKQQEAFDRILNPQKQNEEVVTEVNNLPVHSNPPQPPIQRIEIEDPIITMFKKTKRNVEFNITLDVSDKIPRLDFIEMMEDSYEISMIDFLADEFTNKIIQDPSLIRNKIKDKIKQLVYGGIKSVKKEVNTQITDAVTQSNKTNKIEKPKTTRKPREKKETVDK